MKKIFALITLAAVIVTSTSLLTGYKTIKSRGSEGDSGPVDMGPIYYNGSTEGETFLIGLDGNKIKASEIKYLLNKNFKPTNILDENDFRQATCEGFTYAFKPSEYTDSTIEPDKFINNGYDYIGERTAASSDYFRVNVGDKFGGLTVKSAKCNFNAYTLNKEEYLGYNRGELEFDGEITLTGTLVIPDRLPQYNNMVMEMKFYSELENGIPLSLECSYRPEFGADIQHGVHEQYKTYSDIPHLDLRKITEYDLDFDGLSHGDSARVEITVTGLRLFANLNDPCYAYAELVDIKRL